MATEQHCSLHGHNPSLILVPGRERHALVVKVTTYWVIRTERGFAVCGNAHLFFKTTAHLGTHLIQDNNHLPFLPTQTNCQLRRASDSRQQPPVVSPNNAVRKRKSVSRRLLCRFYRFSGILLIVFSKDTKLPIVKIL